MGHFLLSVLKYIANFIIIYLLFKYIPNKTLPTSDVLIMTSIVMLVYILLEKLSTLTSSQSNSVELTPYEKIAMCNSVCMTKPETMANTHNEPPLIANNIASNDTQNRPPRDEYSDVLTDEMPYTDYNHLPMADGYDSRDYEYGYSFLPPEKWYPQPPNPPVCVVEKKCPVCPILTTGGPVDMKEWNSSRRITQPDNINVNYVNDKLNSGH